MSVDREWTGRLYETDATTDDGRRIAAGAVTPDAVMEFPEPRPMEQWDSTTGFRNLFAVGRVDGLAEIGGHGIAYGRTTLEPGTYTVAVSLDDVETITNDDGVLIVTEGRLRGVAVMSEEDGEKAKPPVWGTAQIVVHPSGPDDG